MKPMRPSAILLTLLPLFFLILPVAASAGVQGADFDSMPTGPYLGPAVIGGDPSTVTVETVESLGQSAPPGSSGNVLAIDNRNGTAPVLVTFTYDCDALPLEICEINYKFHFEAWYYGAWIGVYVDDDGSYTNPDHIFEPPLIIPPSLEFGDHTEREFDCSGMHIITFWVAPGAVAYLDDFLTRCTDLIPNEKTTWSMIKGMYR